MAEEYTLIFLKPSAVERGLVGEILSRFERKGLKIVELRMMTMTREMAEDLYSVHRGKPFFGDLIEAVSGKRIVAAILKGREAISAVRTLIGATDPVKAAPGTIRGDFGLDITDNVIHASDSPESFRREVKVLFPEFQVPEE
ncbi:nucleoside-diphosphate kinase [Candidatus Geothermarchaeota archaeon ex4572_27]|nr:MAG: nucleoside-diphosphate kinase [Candidatus Geothermarchaeota archaeon ex4572_27]